MINNQQVKLSNFLDDIYKNEGYAYGIDYFSQFLPNLKKYNFAEILAYQAKFPLQYVLGFILSTPSLWVDFTVTDWIRVMSGLTPRRNPFSIEIFDAGYSDIHFLCKFVRVNAIELFLGQKHFSNEDKRKVLQYSNKIACFLFMDELDLENLDGNYFLHQDQLDRVRHKLICTGKVIPLNDNELELRKYIEDQLEVLLREGNSDSNRFSVPS